MGGDVLLCACVLLLGGALGVVSVMLGWYWGRRWVGGGVVIV